MPSDPERRHRASAGERRLCLKKAAASHGPGPSGEARPLPGARPTQRTGTAPLDLKSKQEGRNLLPSLPVAATLILVSGSRPLVTLLTREKQKHKSCCVFFCCCFSGTILCVEKERREGNRTSLTKVTVAPWQGPGRPGHSKDHTPPFL